MFIGGPLEFNPDILLSEVIGHPNDQLGIADSKICWTRSGRSALSIVLNLYKEDFSDGWFLLPDYQCWGVNDVFSSINCKYTPINKDLILDPNLLESALEDNELKGVLLIDYFGLTNIEKSIDLIKSRRPDIIVIIDAAMSFFSLLRYKEKYPKADAIIASPRKFLPVPDGGLVVTREEDLLGHIKNKNQINQEQISAYLSASILRVLRKTANLGEELSQEIESIYLRLFQEHNSLFDNQINCISSLSMEIIKRSNLDGLSNQRESNYKLMQNMFSDNEIQNIVEPVFSDIPSPALNYPVRVKGGKRDNLRSYLASKGIFCPIHWPVPRKFNKHLGNEALEISKEILGLPIDQRCDSISIARLFGEIESFTQEYK